MTHRKIHEQTRNTRVYFRSNDSASWSG